MEIGGRDKRVFRLKTDRPGLLSFKADAAGLTIPAFGQQYMGLRCCPSRLDMALTKSLVICLYNIALHVTNTHTHTVANSPRDLRHTPPKGASPRGQARYNDWRGPDCAASVAQTCGVAQTCVITHLCALPTQRLATKARALQCTGGLQKMRKNKFPWQWAVLRQLCISGRRHLRTTGWLPPYCWLLGLGGAQPSVEASLSGAAPPRLFSGLSGAAS